MQVEDKILKNERYKLWISNDITELYDFKISPPSIRKLT